MLAPPICTTLFHVLGDMADRDRRALSEKLINDAAATKTQLS